MSSKQSSTESKFSRGPRGGADVIGPLLEVLAERPDLTSTALYWVVKSRIPPEKAALYWRVRSHQYVGAKSLGDQLEVGGKRLTFEYLHMLRRKGLVANHRIGPLAAWSLTEAGLARARNGAHKA